jgi:hypothetical protein
LRQSEFSEKEKNSENKVKVRYINTSKEEEISHIANPHPFLESSAFGNSEFGKLNTVWD